MSLEKLLTYLDTVWQQLVMIMTEETLSVCACVRERERERGRERLRKSERELIQCSS